MIKQTDIAFVLSGGATNRNPLNSLGGPASSFPIQGTMNNLFTDLTIDETIQGITDYRCFYCFNDNPEFTWEGLSIELARIPDCCDIAFGTTVSNELQQITIGNATGGGIRFRLGDFTFWVPWDQDEGEMALAIQRALRRIGRLVDVVCVSVGSGVYSVSFGGRDGQRAYPLLEVESNQLSPSGTSITILRLTAGSPINAVAPRISVPTQTPWSVTFDAFLSVGRIEPGDGFPIWVRRTASNASQGEGVGFTLFFTGSVLPPSDPIEYDFFVTIDGGMNVSGQSQITTSFASYTVNSTGGININGAAGGHGYRGITTIYYGDAPGYISFGNQYTWSGSPTTIGGARLQGNGTVQS